jgi:hypothetical protein
VKYSLFSFLGAQRRSAAEGSRRVLWRFIKKISPQLDLLYLLISPLGELLPSPLSPHPNLGPLYRIPALEKQ